MWLLMIMLSVGPFNEQYRGENDVWLHIQMRSQAECMMAAQNVITTARVFQDLNPDLHVEAICRKDIPMHTTEETNYIKRINYRQCLDLINEN
jgi:hypothetical protein